MGVHGLMTYILGNSELFLKKHELSDCYLVIDGNNLACMFFQQSKSHSAFGGDYDEYYAIVKNFMSAFKKCNVCPIVLLDGGCEKAKLKTRLSRRIATVSKLQLLSQGFSTEQYFPIFLVEVFKDAVRDLGFICLQCDLEADGEIAAVARILNCPVLSHDSDYFIYDVPYIPFSTIKLTPTKYSHKNKHYIECLLYDVNEFLEIVGIDKPLLPILATLLGNDYVENHVFYKFFNHVRMPQGKNKSHAQKRLNGLINWLKNENITSAKKLILSHLKNKNADKVLKLFNRTINDYKKSTVSKAVFNKLTNMFGDKEFIINEFSLNWPGEMSELYGQGYIPGFIMNMILYQFYLTPVQVENIYDHSTHYKSSNLIRTIYAMISPYLKYKKPLTVYLPMKKEYKGVRIDIDPSPNVNLEEILKEPAEVRLKLLCDIVGVPMEDLEIVPSNSWTMFLLGILYWVKKFESAVSLVHIHAFVIMVIMNQIVQTKVGYYRNSPDFTKHHGDQLAKLKGAEITLGCSSSFEEMLKNVNKYECLLLQKELIPLRRTTEAGSGHGYCISTIHLFNCFQSCLYYIMTINALLNHPLPCLRMGDFYSGTLLFNLYLSIKSKTSVEKFGSTLFQKTPNLNEIYKYLTKSLSQLINTTNVGKLRKTRKKRSSKKKESTLNEVENIIYATDDEGGFMDKNNQFALLYKIPRI